MRITDINPHAIIEDGRLYSYSFMLYPDIADVLKLFWTEVIPGEDENLGKNLYFSSKHFSRECRYPISPNCEVAVFESNDKNNMYYYVNECYFPKLKTVYMFSHPCGSQYRLLDVCDKIIIPLRFNEIWRLDYSWSHFITTKMNAKIYGENFLDEKRILAGINHKLEWQNAISQVHTELSYSPVGKNAIEAKERFYQTNLDYVSTL